MERDRRWGEMENEKIIALNDEIIGCRKCERLVAWREQIATKKTRAYRSWEYWGRPVPGFGDFSGRVLVVGLAPGAHGSNRTGRMFTGDGSGDFLFPALHRAGFANQPQSSNRDDGLKVKDMFITAVCRCVPPDNKPTKSEIANCSSFLQTEILLMENLQVIVTLGSIAHTEIYRYFENLTDDIPIHKFQHNGKSIINGSGLTIISSYHPSRQNTQTGRLTVTMFDDIWKNVNSRLQDLL